jgi:hypothetical protein
VDYISSGAWSNTLHVPIGDLIASDYMVGQGSIPPAITNSSAGAGGIFTYIGYANALYLYCAPFSVYWPNGTIDTIPWSSGVFVQTLDTGVPLAPLTPYGFFPSVFHPGTPTPSIEFNGPYENYSGTSAALTGMFQDGSSPMTNGAMVCQTSDAATGSSGGSTGGTGGGGNCGVLSSLMYMADGSRIPLAELHPGMWAKTRSGRAKVVRIELLTEETYLLYLANGMSTRVAIAHTLFFSDKRWDCLERIFEALEEDNPVWVDTLHGMTRVICAIAPETSQICKIHLSGENVSDDDHVYILDGIWTHNNMIKNG